MSKYGVLNAVNLTTGQLIWSQQVGTPGVGAIATPALSGTDLVVSTDSTPNAQKSDGGAATGIGVFDFDAITGHLRWNFADPAGGDASPAIVGPTNERVVVFADFAGNIDLLSMRNGSLLYQTQTGSYIVASPAEADGNIFEVSGNGFLYDLAPGGENITAPTTSVTSPANGSDVTNPDGSLTVTGNASATAGVDSVDVLIRAGAGKWWDGSTGTWTDGSYSNVATLASPGGSSTTWSTSFPAPAEGGAYEVFASAVSDNVADVSAGLSPPTASRSSFSVEPSTTEPILRGWSGTSGSWHRGHPKRRRVLSEREGIRNLRWYQDRGHHGHLVR